MPLVEDLSLPVIRKGHHNVSKGGRRTAQVNYRYNDNDFDDEIGTQNTGLTVAQQRVISRHLEDLEKENNPTLETTGSTARLVEIPKPISYLPAKYSNPAHLPYRRKTNSSVSTPGVKKILGSKKTLSNFLDEDEFSANLFLHRSLIGPSSYPTRRVCTVCGHWQSGMCSKCGMRFCSMRCMVTHLETDCTKSYM